MFILLYVLLLYDKVVKEAILRHRNILSISQNKIKEENIDLKDIEKESDNNTEKINSDKNNMNNLSLTKNNTTDNTTKDSGNGVNDNETLQQNQSEDIEMKGVDKKKNTNEKVSTLKSEKQQQTTTPVVAERNAIFRKPLQMGWKRELVHRANPQSHRDKGEAYYITPSGKKLRTKGEIIPYLTPETGLTIENFTFTREPLGFGPDEEIVRSAKLKSSSSDSLNRRSQQDNTNSNLGKRIPKPKAPKGASPPPQGWTPAKVDI